jgi:quercetin dioxygenase-like cupin family protein
MEIKRIGTQPSGKEPADYFTGIVRINSLNAPPEPARVSTVLLAFEPGARTAGHTHPLGRTRVVTGLRWVQRDGGPIEDIRLGDVIWFEPREKHWHGASPTRAMSRFAIQEKPNGSPVDWVEHVTNAQYRRDA